MPDRPTETNERLSRSTVLKIIRDAIDDEKRLPQDFHKGRVSALSFALDLLESMEGGDQ